MKFALFILPSWPEQDTKHQSRAFGEAVEQIQFAEELGFDSVWLAEHHFTRFGVCPLALPFAHFVAAKTSKIRIGTGVTVVNFHDPIFLAEEAAMLDVLSGGNLIVGVGEGSTKSDFDALGLPFDERRKMLEARVQQRVQRY